MAQIMLERVLEEIKTLDIGELHQVQRAVETHLATQGYAPEEYRALQSLVEAGLLAEIKPRRQESPPRPLVPIQGKPLSETVIEERR